MYWDLQLQSSSASGDFFSCPVVVCSLIQNYKIFNQILCQEYAKVSNILFPSVCLDNFAANVLVKEQIETEFS